MKRIASLTAFLIVTAAASACGPGDRGATGTVDSTAVTSTPVPTTSTSTPLSTTTTVPKLSTSSRLRIDGLGPIDVGMTVAEARAVAGTELSLEKGPYCDVLRAPRGPAGVLFVITDPPGGRIEVIMVTGSAVATVSGIRVGSTEAEVLATYPGRLRTLNPSLPVHKLVYEARDPALADRVLVFVIDNARVATMYTGVRNQADADEICS